MLSSTKSEVRQQRDQQSSTKPSGHRATLMPPAGRGIAQLEALAARSPQSAKLAQFAAMAAGAPAHAAQRKLNDMTQGIGAASGVLQAKTKVLRNLNNADDEKTADKLIETPTVGTAWFRFEKQGKVIDSFEDNITTQLPKGTGHVIKQIDIEDNARLDGVAPDDIPGYSRPWHFKWGDAAAKIKDSDRTGKYTWHHKNDPYQMELVDMYTHGGFFHYGGYSQWQDRDEDDAED